MQSSSTRNLHRTIQFVIGNHTSYKQDIGLRPGKVIDITFKSTQMLILFLNLFLTLKLIFNQ